MIGGNSAGMDSKSNKLHSSAGRPESNPTDTSIRSTNSCQQLQIIDFQSNQSISQLALEALSNLDALNHNSSAELSLPNNWTDSITKEYHLSKINPNVSSEQISSFIVSKIHHIDVTKELRVFRLTKRNQDLSKLSFVNFKLESSDRIGRIISQDNFWSEFCNIIIFIRKLPILIWSWPHRQILRIFGTAGGTPIHAGQTNYK